MPQEVNLASLERRAMLQALTVVIEKSPSDVDSKKRGKHCCFPGGVAAHAVHIPHCMTLMLGQGQWDSAAEQSLGLFQSGFVETGNEGINNKQEVTLHFLSAISHRMSHKHSSELSCDESNK